jgi:hypothetical protein
MLPNVKMVHVVGSFLESIRYVTGGLSLDKIYTPPLPSGYDS